MSNLATGRCVACRAGEPTLTEAEIEALLPQVPHWQLRELDGMQRLERSFKFRNFVEALDFANKVGAIAEQENHHPLLTVEWGRVMLQWWTHKIGGLHRNDFIMATKSDELYRP